jgi:hypothetical protein
VVVASFADAWLITGDVDVVDRVSIVALFSFTALGHFAKPTILPRIAARQD